jgi:hypothetical protein
MKQTRKKKPTSAKHFVAVDGEAIDGKYVLLGTSHPSYCLEDKQGIKTDDALDFLWRLGSNRHLRKKRTSFVGFYFSYDVEMICRDLPDKIKRRLFHPRMILTKQGTFKKDRIFYKDYELTYIKRKYFSIRRKGTPQNGITIFDVCGFFVGQGSFIKVLQQMLIDVPDEIISGKAERGAFTWENYQNIKRYNQIECEKLCELMHRILEMTEKQGLTPRRWYGSSAIANLALRKWKINEYMRRTVEENMSGYFWDGITRAYFGGRIEAFKLGSFKNVHTYDVNSAYPSAIMELPKTRHNRFIYTRSYKKGFAIWHVRYDFNRTRSNTKRIGVLPFRTKEGSIKFPLVGEGWYWNPEIEMALKVAPQCVDVIEGYYLESTHEKTPFKEIIPQLYKARVAYKKKNDLTQWIIKILLNALYGKFAQKVGRADFKNFIWSGWITSHTRAKLREAIIGKEQHIIAFATDGIYSLAKLPSLQGKLSEKIGEWDYTPYKRATVLMSGVYLLEGEKIKTGQRGFSELSQWHDILEQLNTKRKVKINIKVFVGFNMAFNFPLEYGEHYLKFVEKVKELNPANLTKRKYFTRTIKDWTTDYCESEPIKKLSGMSEPIKTAIDFVEDTDLIFGDDESAMIWSIKE